MLRLIAVVLLLHEERAFVFAAAPTIQNGYCTSKLTDELLVTCKYAPDTDGLRRDLKGLNTTVPFNLAISDVNITVLPAFFFEGFKFDFLRINKCGMESLHDDSLVGVDSLTLLDLSKNGLTTIPRAISALKSLRMLYIAENRITAVGLELRPVSSTLGKVNLYGNSISSIDKDALKDMSSLMRITLKKNIIRDIATELFRTAPRLQQIDLRWNVIENVDNLFDGLLELHTLKLEHNNIHHIRTLSASNLPSLQSVTLDYNPIDTFSLFDSRNAAVENLSLQHCNISDVSSIPFACIDRLRFLKIPYNRIRHIDGNSFPKSVNTSNYYSFGTSSLYASKCGSGKNAGILMVIDISHNYIDAINNAFHGIQLLEHLDMSDNELTNVPDDAFKTNINLKRLQLRRNNITWIGAHAFRGLVGLEELDLSSNWLRHLNTSLAFMPRLGTLYLRQNQLLVVGEFEFESLPHLKFLHLDGNNLSDVRGAFKNLVALQSLSLTDNNLSSIHRASFPKEMKQLNRIAIEGNPLMCDCQISWLYEIPSLYMDRVVPLCHGPPRLEGTPFLSKEARSSLGVWFQDCDEMCTCTCVVSDYSRYIKADCSNRSLETTPRTFPKDTFVVDLSENLLDTLDVSLAKYAPRVKNLNLANNLYTSLDWNALPTGLEKLFLQNNSFKGFPLGVVSNLNLSEIWLSGNPWSCKCEDYSFRQWAESHEDTIKDAGDVRCAAGANNRVSSKLFMELEQKDLCPFKMSLFVIYGVPLLVVFSACLAVTMIYLKREQQIKIWLYAHGLHCVKEDDLDKDKMFDVFLSFSSKDSEWAYTQLLPGLEESGFSVCTYDRNFKGGFLLQDIIQEAVACSRRTLLVLTQNFVESEWCRWEFRVAHHAALKEKINRLVVLVVGNIPENVDADLQLYMKTTNYVCWGEKNFWDKLRYSLPKLDPKNNASAGALGDVPMTRIYKNNIQR